MAISKWKIILITGKITWFYPLGIYWVVEKKFSIWQIVRGLKNKRAWWCQVKGKAIYSIVMIDYKDIGIMCTEYWYYFLLTLKYAVFVTSGVTKQNRKNKDRFRTGFLKHASCRPLVKQIDSPVLTSYHWLSLLQCQAGQDACVSCLFKSTTVTPSNYNTVSQYDSQYDWLNCRRYKSMLKYV